MEKNKRIFKLTISSEILVGLLFPVSSSSLGQSSFFFFLEILFFPLGGMLFPGVLCCFLECCEWNGKLLHRLPFIHEKVRRSHIRRSSVAARHVSVSHPRGPQQSCAVRYDTRHNRHDPGQLLRIAAVARRTSRGYVLRSVANPLDTVIIRPYPPLSAAIRNNPTLQHVMNPPRIRGDPWHQKVNFWDLNFPPKLDRWPRILQWNFRRGSAS